MADLLQFLNKSFNFSLTQSQVEAANSLDSFFSGNKNCFILKGYAGTGKTTLLYGISRYLASKHRRFKLMAPTGRAAKVIADKTKYDAFTIHKSVYSMDDLKEYKETKEDGSETFKYFFGLQNNDDTTDTVYIVDESSMVSDQYSEGEFFRFGSGFLLNDVFKHIDFTTPNITRQILFIGDSAQLPPVNMNFSPALDKKYLSELPYNLSIDEIELTDVARQKQNSGILINATSIREQIAEKRFNKIRIETEFEDINPIQHVEIVNNYLNCKTIQNDNDMVIIAYSNKSVQHYNDLIRERLFPKKKTIQPKDRFLVVRNNYNYGVLNGEFGTINKVYTATETEYVGLRKKTGNIQVELKFRDVCVEVLDIKGKAIEFDCKIIENQLDSKEPQLTSDEQRALYVLFKKNNPELKAGTPEFKEAIKTDKYFNALQVKYGYAVTCHKAQGGEWDNCIIDFFTSQPPFNEPYFRWCYTALTRCKENLYSLNAPQLSPADGLEITESNPSSKKDIQSILVSENNLVGIPENLSFENEFQLGFCRKVLSLIESNTQISDIKHNQFSERYYFVTEPESTVIDFSYNKNGKITSIRAIKVEKENKELIEKLNPIVGQIFLIETNDSNSVEISFEDKQTHLKEFFVEIEKKLNDSNIRISKIEHNQYHEKYHFTRNDEFAIFLFYYDGKKRFKKVVPEENTSNSTNLINTITDLL